jgi:decaprenylphospho-beta-D-erythro-pentofuranosid-2-ulose 2-reductase
VKNAFGDPQTILLLGGTSEIGLAIVRRLATPATRTVVLACRDERGRAAAASGLAHPGRTVEVVRFDALDSASHVDVLHAAVAQHGDLDVVVLAFGVLGSQEEFDRDPVAAAGAVQTNFVGAVSAGLGAATQLRAQGHGALVVLSSVAGERVRKANFVYGSSKAGLDAFAQGLGDSLAGSGASVLVVRPGFVHSKMTAGMKSAPFATTPDKVADAVAAGLRRGSRTIWVPGILRAVFAVFRHLPGPVWRRLPI